MSGLKQLNVVSLGLEDYLAVWERMSRFADLRGPDTPDEIWLVEHPPVFTLGQAGRVEHLLNTGDIPVVHSDRGGQVTYHGPGQLVAYPLLDLRRLGIKVRQLVNTLEEVLIKTLADYGIRAERKTGAPGVYTNDGKIASLGLRIRKGCTIHGVSLNVDMDTQPFSRINPCGFAGLQVTQMRDFVPEDVPLRVGGVSAVLVEHLCDLLGYSSRTP
ncbi:lipoyl(octanoyl) transferase LipB [Proteobacteria bacterium 005FR1]|nr:lipoyl(octanoyl) transferase LipB [Proteobacteria bacterium 005FR1]